jgi:decaprenylphospho-beta-D-ribofuranose 2-oxidase
MEPSVTRPLSGWGRYPVETCNLYRPEKRRSLAEILASDREPTWIARGLGRSYGDAALNAGAGVISFERLNRFIGFDPDSGVLECEGGTSLEEILRHFLPRGYFPPVTPGTKFVTIGGAIAHDVHGKNHHRAGTISAFVLDFRLLTPRGETLTCSREENPDVFWATVGGTGLTGLIVSARLRLAPVETAYLRVDYQRAGNVEEAAASLTESDHLYEHSVAWIDCLARGRALGRSVLMRANHAKKEEVPAHLGDPLSPRRAARRSIPFDFPSVVLSPLAIRAFNALFYEAHRTVAGKIVDYDRFFYPLDSIHHWNRMYGKRGFTQYQVVFPAESGLTGLVELLRRLSASGRGSFLGVLKRFGDANSGLLSFPRSGYTLALDLPMQEGLPSFLRELDRLLLDHGGRVYLAKDAVTTAESFAAMYPGLSAFRRIKERLDPDLRLSSSLARRVGIVPSERRVASP